MLRDGDVAGAGRNQTTERFDYGCVQVLQCSHRRGNVDCAQVEISPVETVQQHIGRRFQGGAEGNIDAHKLIDDPLDDAVDNAGRNRLPIVGVNFDGPGFGKGLGTESAVIIESEAGYHPPTEARRDDHRDCIFSAVDGSTRLVRIGNRGRIKQVVQCPLRGETGGASAHRIVQQAAANLCHIESWSAERAVLAAG